MGDKKSPTRPKRQPKPSSDEGYWDCSVCTFRNGAEAFKCMMCDVRKGTSTRSTFFEVIVNASRTEGPLQFPISGSSGGRRQKSLRLHRGRESGSVRQRPNRRTPGPDPVCLCQLHLALLLRAVLSWLPTTHLPDTHFSACSSLGAVLALLWPRPPQVTCVLHQKLLHTHSPPLTTHWLHPACCV
ncbi:YY1-associated factor 2 isoform X1 [Oryctolagus cuniculus]|uniref:YY1-associated factor 2 isoform X1 n=1 Tax=Oryctolagus cuniculus TaxID=9986 RepID=UPI0038793061